MAKKNETTIEQQEHLTATESFFDKNKKYLFIAGGAVVAIVLGYFAYNQLVTKPHIEESHEAYWNAFYEYQENDSTGLAITGNDNFQGFEDIASEYDGTPGGEIANYALATTAMENQEWENALAYLDDCDFEDVMVGTMVIGMKGDCNVELGNYEDAAKFFEEAAQREENEYTTPMFLKKAGLVYEELGDMESAVTAYQKIKDNWSAAVEAGDIDKYIVRAQN